MTEPTEVERTIGAPVERIVETWPAVMVRGPDGTTVVTAAPAATTEPQYLETTVTSADGAFRFVARTALRLSPDGEGTQVGVRTIVDALPSEATAAVAGLDEAWTTALEQLDAAVTGTTVDPADRSIAGTVEVDAPADVVWTLWTSPEHIARWWGPTGYTTEVHEMDVRPGGDWLFTMSGPAGIFDNHVVYLVVEEPARIVYAHGVTGRPDRFVATATFSQHEGGTTVSVTSRFPTPQDKRRAAEEFGASEGLKQTLGNLATYLEELGQPSIIKMHHDTL